MVRILHIKHDITHMQPMVLQYLQNWAMIFFFNVGVHIPAPWVAYGFYVQLPHGFSQLSRFTEVGLEKVLAKAGRLVMGMSYGFFDGEKSRFWDFRDGS